MVAPPWRGKRKSRPNHAAAPALSPDQAPHRRCRFDASKPRSGSRGRRQRERRGDRKFVDPEVSGQAAIARFRAGNQASRCAWFDLAQRQSIWPPRGSSGQLDGRASWPGARSVKGRACGAWSASRLRITGVDVASHPRRAKESGAKAAPRRGTTAYDPPVDQLLLTARQHRSA
jgi:hypothetical protein